MGKAIGLIEVTGYVAAVEAADSAVKAASVTLIGIEKVKAGISTVKVTGDVGAVKAAVDAAAASADSLGLLRTCHVIPRVDEQVDKFFFMSSSEKNSQDKEEEKLELVNEEQKATEDINVEVVNEEVTKDEAYYNSMKVEELRRYVRNLQIPTMTNKQIKFAKKDVLVKAILDYNKAGEK